MGHLVPLGEPFDRLGFPVMVSVKSGKDGLVSKTFDHLDEDDFGISGSILGSIAHAGSFSSKYSAADVIFKEIAALFCFKFGFSPGFRNLDLFLSCHL